MGLEGFAAFGNLRKTSENIRNQFFRFEYLLKSPNHWKFQIITKWRTIIQTIVLPLLMIWLLGSIHLRSFKSSRNSFNDPPPWSSQFPHEHLFRMLHRSSRHSRLFRWFFSWELMAWAWIPSQMSVAGQLPSEGREIPAIFPDHRTRVCLVKATKDKESLTSVHGL